LSPQVQAVQRQSGEQRSLVVATVASVVTSVISYLLSDEEDRIDVPPVAGLNAGAKVA
jgi:hypothetical protein